MRNGRLDNFCESIGEDRKRIAQLKADEQGSIQGALKEMKAKNVGAYKHAGVELAFVPGADKLRVRLTNDDSDSAAGLPSDAGEGDEAEADEAEGAEL